MTVLPVVSTVPGDGEARHNVLPLTRAGEPRAEHDGRVGASRRADRVVALPG